MVSLVWLLCRDVLYRPTRTSFQVFIMLVSDICYSAPVGKQSIVMSVTICVSICPHARMHRYLQNHVIDLYQIFCACFPWPWQHCDTLCASVFVDDVTFSDSGHISVNTGVESDVYNRFVCIVSHIVIARSFKVASLFVCCSYIATVQWLEIVCMHFSGFRWPHRCYNLQCS